MQEFSKRAWAEIHLDRLARNVCVCRGFLKDTTELMSVVKANAYGHGDDIVAPFLEKNGVKWFAVSNICEAMRLRFVGIKGEIFILGYVTPAEIKKLFELNGKIIQAITSLENAEELSRNIPEGKMLRTHIKIDTGMGRIGLKHRNVSNYADEIEEILAIKNISVEGIFTHLSVADSDNPDNILYTKNQIELITKIYAELERRDIHLEHLHFLNSAGATYHSDGRSTLARYGIMLYGLHPNFSLDLPIPLEPVMEFKAIVSHIKTLEKGECVSYGRLFTAEKTVRVASLTVGYADGYSRLLSSKGEVLVNGKRAKIIGSICMDQTMIDVSDIDVKVGDTATLFGIDGEDSISADDIAGIYGTIGYEVVCGVSKRVPRVFFNNGEIVDVTDR